MDAVGRTEGSEEQGNETESDRVLADHKMRGSDAHVVQEAVARKHQWSACELLHILYTRDGILNLLLIILHVANELQQGRRNSLFAF